MQGYRVEQQSLTRGEAGNRGWSQNRLDYKGSGEQDEFWRAANKYEMQNSKTGN